MIKINPMITLPDFSDWEFDCKCGCGLNNMEAIFLWKLQQTRTEAMFPFIIRSGTRCQKHNADVGGKLVSDHLSGQGADIEVKNSQQRFKLIEKAIECGFRRIGVGKTFVHLGDNPNNPQLVMWVY